MRQPGNRRDRTPSSEGVVTSGRGLRRYAGLILLTLAAVGGSGPTGSLEAQRRQDIPNAIEAERAIAQLRSPYCPGFMLEVCTSYQAAALRDSLYMLAAEGMTAGELVEWMIGNHGEEWRAVPQRSGAGLWAWLAPPLALLLGLVLVVVWFRSVRKGEAAAVRTATVTAEERERLARALQELEESGEEVV